MMQFPIHTPPEDKWICAVISQRIRLSICMRNRHTEEGAPSPPAACSTLFEFDLSRCPRRRRWKIVFKFHLQVFVWTYSSTASAACQKGHLRCTCTARARSAEDQVPNALHKYACLPLIMCVYYTCKFIIELRKFMYVRQRHNQTYLLDEPTINVLLSSIMLVHAGYLIWFPGHLLVTAVS